MATLYSSFSERPKHLDPAVSYTLSEAAILSQIYEPPLQYHYLKRPYTLEPLTASALPEVTYFSAAGQRLPQTASQDEIAYSEYLITIKPGIVFQAHPAFVKDKDGQYRYLQLSEKEASRYRTLADFKETATRELTAEDYVYQIKRLAEPSLNSPIYGLMSKHIEGLTELRETLILERQQKEKKALENGMEVTRLETDLRAYKLSGAEALDKYRYRIRIRGKYPQFRFWLAMNFFAPIPWEVALFYAQPGLQRHNISLDWYPVGTGPFQLTENNPERRMTLLKNPNYREEYFPSQVSKETDNEAKGSLEKSHQRKNSQGYDDQEKGNEALLVDAGKRLPLIDKVVFSLERESIPFWNKFLQGYYDVSPIASDNFSSAIRLNAEGKLVVTQNLLEKNIRLTTSVSPNVFYWGFNMLDKTVGGDTVQARKLRQAITLSFDVEEFISIFLNGRGVLAKGPIPPDIFGYETQLLNQENENVKQKTFNVTEVTEKGNQDQNQNIQMNPVQHKNLRKEKIEKAKKLLKEAGYARGTPIYLDIMASGEPDEIAIHAWLKEQFEKIGLKLIIRGTSYNRFQDKILQGDTQMFFLGWTADYPDPENFLFLFYGPNAAVSSGGENKTNYSNPEYDRLFEKMRLLENGPERLALIAEMIQILQRDTPWIWGFYPKSFVLYQGWTRVTKPSTVINNNLKYFNIYPEIREKSRRLWNQPLLWPLTVFIVFLVFVVLFGFFRYRHQTQTKIRERI